MIYRLVLYIVSQIKGENQKQPKKVKSPGPRPALNSRQINCLKNELLKENPKTQKALASQFNMSRGSVQRYIEKLGMKKVKKPKVHAITQRNIELRRLRSLALSNRLNGIQWENYLTSDEAWVYSTPNQGTRDIQYISRSQTQKNAAVQAHVAHPQSCMVWLVISSKGVISAYFVPPKVKINIHFYVDKILKHMKRYGQKIPKLGLYIPSR